MGLATPLSSSNAMNQELYERLLDLQERAAAMIEADLDLLFVIDKEGTFVDFQGNKAELMLQPEQFLGRKIDEVLPDYLAELTREKLKLLFETNEMQVYDYNSELNGEILTFESRLVNYGKDKALSIVRNITEKRKQELAIRASERRYQELYNLFRLLADSTTDMIWAKDLDKKFLFVNKAICKDLLNATDTQEPIGKTDLYFAERVRARHPENPQWHTFGEICVDSDAVTLRELRPMSFEEFGNVKGKFIFLEVYKVPLYNQEGKLIGVVGTARNVTEKKEMEEQLKHSEQTYKGILDSLSECVYILDENGKILETNHVASDFSGYAYKDLLGQPLDILIAKEITNIEEVKENLAKAFNGQKLKFECWGIDAKGRYVPKQVSMSSGTFFGKPCAIGIVRDISEEKEWEKTLIEAKQKAEENDKLKTAFLANMSHEIRIPLNGILGFAELLTDDNVSPNQVNHYASIILSSAHRLLAFMNNVLDISKIESGSEELMLSDFKIYDLLHEVLSNFESLASKKNLTISLVMSPEYERLLIKSDYIKLHRVLSNLLDNAIKFTKEGQITVSFKKDNQRLLFEVEDTGMGISTEHIGKIFERFYQTSYELTRGWEGAGLGLAITKKLVEIMGGEIGVKSMIGTGSVFTFSIPYIPGKSITQEYLEEKSHDKKYTYTVLVVEDDDSGYQLLETLLQVKGCEVLHADTGIRALEIFHQRPDIDIILLDIKLPGLDGRQVLKAIKEKRPKIPVIAQTAYAMEGDREKFLEAGFDGYLAKPILAAKFYELLEQFLPSKIM